MKYILCVINPFTFNGVDYKRGDEIKDSKLMAAILASENAYQCNKVSA